MTTQSITRLQLQTALARCCDANPSTGPGRRLHPDASLMADLFGIMLHHRAQEADTAGVAPAILEAYQRWASPA
ncbi:DUF3717 domain-containing protein [Pseudomonas sp. Marseille-Q5115]|uniref:DUF3717 domain-containing protein n=1 Tax=Pseudomonas sp. Marseille-Q5115 TaxID=2866593 RepID=UPI001CE3C090|nr:DUF3717 domain-containing protein [Pseudomonas sp. Marseille-Q5115]